MQAQEVVYFNNDPFKCKHYLFQIVNKIYILFIFYGMLIEQSSIFLWTNVPILLFRTSGQFWSVLYRMLCLTKRISFFGSAAEIDVWTNKKKREISFFSTISLYLYLIGILMNNIDIKRLYCIVKVYWPSMLHVDCFITFNPK
jgi:hypothetical protein